jgi:hypothetical protein
VADLDRPERAGGAVIRFVAGRLAASVVIVFVVATASFWLLHAAPGGPFDTDERRSAAVTRAMEDRYGLHQPLWRQYGRAMARLAHGDLGVSMKRDVSVTTLIAEHGPISAVLGLLGLSAAVVIGVALGVVAAWRRNTWVDALVMTGALIGISVPAFVLGPLLYALVESERRAGGTVECIAHDDRLVVSDGDEAAIEGGVEVRGEQEAVVDVEPLGVRVAVSPGLDVARAEERPHREPGDGAAPLPEVQKRLAEQVLADALDHEALGLACARPHLEFGRSWGRAPAGPPPQSARRPRQDSARGPCRIRRARHESTVRGPRTSGRSCGSTGDS